MNRHLCVMLPLFIMLIGAVCMSEGTIYAWPAKYLYFAVACGYLFCNIGSLMESGEVKSETEEGSSL